MTYYAVIIWSWNLFCSVKGIVDIFAMFSCMPLMLLLRNTMFAAQRKTVDYSLFLWYFCGLLRGAFSTDSYVVHILVVLSVGEIVK
jgi:hypothetical protein